MQELQELKAASPQKTQAQFLSAIRAWMQKGSETSLDLAAAWEDVCRDYAASLMPWLL